MKKKGLFYDMWIFPGLEIFETPYRNFYIKEGKRHAMLLPIYEKAYQKIRKLLDAGVSPFSLDFFSNEIVEIEKDDFKIKEIGVLYYDG